MFDKWLGDDEHAPLALFEELQQQERIWFGWVCRLHDVHAGSQSVHSGAVLAIAQRRWAEARRALDREAHRHRAQWRSDRRPSDDDDEGLTAG
jgi:hypothetical protein